MNIQPIGIQYNSTQRNTTQRNTAFCAGKTPKAIGRIGGKINTYDSFSADLTPEAVETICRKIKELTCIDINPENLEYRWAGRGYYQSNFKNDEMTNHLTNNSPIRYSSRRELASGSPGGYFFNRYIDKSRHTSRVDFYLVETGDKWANPLISFEVKDGNVEKILPNKD